MKFNPHAINKTFQEITGFKVTNLSTLQFVFGAIFCFVLIGMGAATHNTSYFSISIVMALFATLPATIEMFGQIDEEEKEEQ